MSTVNSPVRDPASPVQDASLDHTSQADPNMDSAQQCDPSHPGVRHNMHTGHYGKCVFSVDQDVLYSCLLKSQFSPDKCSSCPKWNPGHRRKFIRFICNLEKHQDSHGLPKCYTPALEEVCQFFLADATDLRREVEGDAFHSVNPGTSSAASEASFSCGVTPVEEDPPEQVPLTIQLMQAFCPELLCKSERLGRSFSSRLEPVAISTSALKTDPALWGNFLRGLNINVSVPPGPLHDVEQSLASGTLTSGPRNMFFDSHLSQNWLSMDLESFPKYFSLGGFQPSAPSASKKVSSPPSSEEKNHYAHAIRAMQLVSEAYGLSSVLSCPDVTDEAFKLAMDRLNQILAALASESGALARPTLQAYRRRFLEKASLSSTFMQEPFSGPSILGPRATSEWDHVPDRLEAVTSSLISLSKNVLKSSQQAARRFNPLGLRGRRARRRGASTPGRFSGCPFTRGASASSRGSALKRPAQHQSAPPAKKVFRGSSSGGRGRNRRV